MSLHLAKEGGVETKIRCRVEEWFTVLAALKDIMRWKATGIGAIEGLYEG